MNSPSPPSDTALTELDSEAADQTWHAEGPGAPPPHPPPTEAAPTVLDSEAADQTWHAESPGAPPPHPPPAEAALTELDSEAADQTWHAEAPGAAPRPQPSPPSAPQPQQTQTSAPGEATAAKPQPPASNDAGLLRGLLKQLVERELIGERAAISLALRAKENGLSILRMISLERTRVDIQGVYQFIGEMLNTDVISTRNDIYLSLAQDTWLRDDLAEQWEVLPLQSDAPDSVRVAMVDPFDLQVLDWIRRRHPGKHVTALPIVPETFSDGLARYRSAALDIESQSGLFVPIDVSWSEADTPTAEVQNWDIPVVVDYILHRSHTQKASDVHIEPHGDNVAIRFRIDGTLHEELRLPISMQAPMVSRIKVLSHLDVAERRLPQDGRISIWIDNHPLDVRISTLPTVSGEKVVMRLLDETSLRPRLELLGLADRSLALLIDKIGAPYGMILISGPTGSGKTTTLYSCLSSIDRVGRNVITIEDPVEYRLQGIQQTQVNEAIGFTFANGLRTVLRQDPDVIMVGECRDRETSQMAVQAALTGHLVLSTIHANDTIGVISRMIDIGVDPFLVSNAVSLVVAQRLLRVHCQHCRTTVTGEQVMAGLRSEGVSHNKIERLGLTITPDLPYVVGAGCARCRYSGYSGRQAVFELFAMTNELRAVIMEDTFDPNRLRQTLLRDGLQTMLQAGMAMVEEGTTSVSEVIRVLGEA